MTTNNITRLLDSRKIKYTAFELPAEKLGALETAAQLNIPPEMVFKTIVVTQKAPGKPILAVVNARQEVDLKLVAQALKAKKVSLPTQDEAEALTGLQAGGISPLALTNKPFLVLLDESSKAFEEIHISGGQRGLNIRLPVKDLIKLTKARVAKIGE
ncbi:MAG: YbaK/EbsC family protein [Anaerolineaceae bacterium]|jgi:Cys-tRNA(Pro)/Cys-tRNA(Cys) deacylase|nr:YbaK/EbsC family protein [Anaerolineaceae bacterium]